MVKLNVTSFWIWFVFWNMTDNFSFLYVNCCPLMMIIGTGSESVLM